eukprot:392470_1
MSSRYPADYAKHCLNVETVRWVLEYGNMGQITNKFDGLTMELLEDKYVELKGKTIQYVELVHDTILVLLEQEEDDLSDLDVPPTIKTMTSMGSVISSVVVGPHSPVDRNGSMNGLNGLNAALMSISDEFVQLKMKYNDGTMNRMMNESMHELIDKESLFNMELTNYKAILNELIMKSNEMTQYIASFQQQIDVYTVLKTKHYTKWNAMEILIWICNLEDGKFNDHKDQLRNGLVTGKVSGEQLPFIQVSELSYPPFNILSLQDRKDMVQHFQSLASVQHPPALCEEEDEKTRSLGHGVLPTRKRNKNNYSLSQSVTSGAKDKEIEYKVINKSDDVGKRYQTIATTKGISTKFKKKDSSIFRKLFRQNTTPA